MVDRVRPGTVLDGLDQVGALLQRMLPPQLDEPGRIGVLPGILALALHSIGMLGKLFAEAIEQSDPGPREAVRATGAGYFREMVNAVVPQVVPSWIATFVCRIDINLRMSVTPAPELAVDPETVVRQWLTITGVHNYEPAHLFRAVEFLSRTQQIYPWDEVVSEPVGLDAIAAALAAPPPGKLRTSVTP